jgi:hypothetical protein
MMPDRSEWEMTRRRMMALGLKAGLVLAWPTWSFAADPDRTTGIEPQPFFAQLGRALDSLAELGSPVAPADASRLAALAGQNDGSAVEAAVAILARYTLATLSVGADGTSRVEAGGAPRTLVEQGWRVFLVRIANPAARADDVILSSGWKTPAGMVPPGGSTAQRASLNDTLNKAPLIRDMWLVTELRDTTPLFRFGREIAVVPLSGIPVEYHVVQLFSRDHGRRRASLILETFPRSGAGGDSSRRELDFDCMPSREVTLGVLDADGRGCVASLTIRDKLFRVYPLQAMRLAPDLFFQPQVYRADGETMRLPDGEYSVESSRGPEYLRGHQSVTVDQGHARIDVRLERWIDPAKWGWFSGDTHIHAGGCAHYQSPTEGVSPETMIRHVRGEGLAIGDVLSWAPSWYYQKQFFAGHAVSPAASLEHPELQAADNATLQPHATAEDGESTLRYDVEVSGFPSSHAGHLVLLRLRDQDYPGTKLIEDWPSWNLPILQWARGQGSVAGYAHCGSGMVVDSTALPNYEIPPMDGIGTQEALVDVTHGVVDFLSGCDTAPIAELNAWYHMLNCGYRLAMIGETDFPCITGERVGVGRSYVRLEGRPVGDPGYEAWVHALGKGRLYCGDGRSHFLEFTVNGLAGGGADVELAAQGAVEVRATVAARLEPEPTRETEAIRARGARPGSWGWHLEQARIGKTREVAVELVVNGVPVDRFPIVADGALRSVRFTAAVERSSWVALRIMPSGHTHPVFVTVAGAPVRASRRSARWCRASVDKLWEVKAPFMRDSERPAAADAFDHARQAYDRIAGECGSA